MLRDTFKSPSRTDVAKCVVAKLVVSGRLVENCTRATWRGDEGYTLTVSCLTKKHQPKLKAPETIGYVYVYLFICLFVCLCIDLYVYLYVCAGASLSFLAASSTAASRRIKRHGTSLSERSVETSWF